MIIQIGIYKLIQEGSTFNLTKMVQVEETVFEEIDGKNKRVKTGNVVSKEIDFGYNMGLDRCIQKIAMENLSNIDLTIDLATWLKMYREEREKITQTINNLN